MSGPQLTPRILAAHTARYVALLAVVAITIVPFLWLLATALKPADEALYGQAMSLWPKAPTLANVQRVFETQPFAKYLLNSALVAALAVGLNLLFSSLAAYALACLPFRGRRVVFVVLLASMMLPFQLLMIPLYELALALGLHNTRLGLVLPHACTAFGIFFLRQAFAGVPAALREVAVIEGVSHGRIWWHVMLPLVKPSLATLAIFSFIAVWGDFLWPLILLDDPQLFTLPLGVNRLASAFSLDWRLVAAGAVTSLVPILVIFSVAQRWFIEGAMKGAVKG